jgi:hypothetical protein
METTDEIIIKFIADEDNSHLLCIHYLATGMCTYDALFEAIDGDTDNPEIIQVIQEKLKHQITDNV